jgi:hypothetical protein
MKTRIALLWVAFCWCAAGLAQPAKQFSVYYVSVGSAHYTPDFSKYEPGFGGFVNVTAAANSAGEVARVLDSHGAKYGKLLVSKKDQYVTRPLVFGAVQEVLKRIKADKPAHPFLVFYFCGHGVSEGLGWNLLMMPGDFVYNIKKNPIDKLAEKSMAVSEVWDAIDLPMPDLPFMLLADCCYEGKDEMPEVKRLQEVDRGFAQAMELTGNVSEIVRVMNQFREDKCVMFSATPGTKVPVVAHPAGAAKGNVGPLGRRLLLAMDNQNAMTWEKLVQMMSRPESDRATKPGVTFWEGHPQGSFQLK